MIIHVHFPVWPDRPATLWPWVHAPARDLLSLHRDPDRDQQHHGSSRSFPRLLLRASCRSLLLVKGPYLGDHARTASVKQVWALEDQNTHGCWGAILTAPLYCLNQTNIMIHMCQVWMHLGQQASPSPGLSGDEEKCLRFKSSLGSSIPPERSCLKRLFSCFWGNKGRKCDSALKQLRVWKRQLHICTFYLHIWTLDKRNALIFVVGTNMGTWAKPEPLDLF